MTRRPTREEAIAAAAEIYLEAKIRLEATRIIVEPGMDPETADSVAAEPMRWPTIEQ